MLIKSQVKSLHEIYKKFLSIIQINRIYLNFFVNCEIIYLNVSIFKAIAGKKLVIYEDNIINKLEIRHIFEK
jgi:hypothetical protein